MLNQSKKQYEKASKMIEDLQAANTTLLLDSEQDLPRYSVESASVHSLESASVHSLETATRDENTVISVEGEKVRRNGTLKETRDMGIQADKTDWMSEDNDANKWVTKERIISGQLQRTDPFNHEDQPMLTDSNNIKEGSIVSQSGSISQGRLQTALSLDQQYQLKSLFKLITRKFRPQTLIILEIQFFPQRKK